MLMHNVSCTVKLVDAYSKWLSVKVMQFITAKKTVQKCYAISATHRIPHTIVTDTSPTFHNKQFKTLMKTMPLN